MLPTLTYGGVDYYEDQVSTAPSLRTAAKLYENWFYHWGAGEDYRFQNVEALLSLWVYDESYGLPQAWILYSFEKPHGVLSSLKPRVKRPEALLLLLAREDADDELSGSKRLPNCPIPPESFYVSVEALCRDPWADASACASWAQKRLWSLSDELGGARELRFRASETDLPLQLALKSLGFYCEGKALSAISLPQLKGHKRMPYLAFTQMLKLRGRQSLASRPLIPDYRKLS